jgi:nucleotide-binding universal stress UspA family protein
MGDWTDFEPSDDREELGLALLTAGIVLDPPDDYQGPAGDVLMDLPTADEVLRVLAERGIRLSREPARTAGDPRVAELTAMAARWEADADAIETSTTSTRNRRRLAAETLRLTASEVRELLALSSGLPTPTPGGEE